MSVVVASILDHSGVFGYRPPDRLQYADIPVVVTYAADGDTIDVNLPDGEKRVTRIRLWGVDAPEIAHDPSEADAHFGREAHAFVNEHIVGQRVRLAFDPRRATRDKYGRLLAYVYLDDPGNATRDLAMYARAGRGVSPAFAGVDKSSEEAGGAMPVAINELLVTRGLAYADGRFEHVMRYRYKQIEKLARKNRVGLWADVTLDRLPGWRQRRDAAATR